MLLKTEQCEWDGFPTENGKDLYSRCQIFTVCYDAVALSFTNPCILFLFLLYPRIFILIC